MRRTGAAGPKPPMPSCTIVPLVMATSTARPPQAPPAVAMSTPSSRLHSDGGTAIDGGWMGKTRPLPAAMARLIDWTTASSWRTSASDGAVACALPTGSEPSPPATPAAGSIACGCGAGKPGAAALASAGACRRWEPCVEPGRPSMTRPATASASAAATMKKRVLAAGTRTFTAQLGSRCAGPRRLPSEDRLAAAHRYELVALAAAAHGLLEHRADPAHVVLVVEDAGLEPRELLREECAVRGRRRGADARRQADHRELVLGLAPVVLLPPALSGARVRRHVDPGPRTVDAGLPRALRAGHLARGVQFRRGLAVVPDVAGRVLRVPVGRALVQPAPGVEQVADDGAAHTLDRLRLVRDREDLARRLAVLHAAVPVDGARSEREPGVVDASRKTGRCCGAPGPAPRHERGRNQQQERPSHDLPERSPAGVACTRGGDSRAGSGRAAAYSASSAPPSIATRTESWTNAESSVASGIVASASTAAAARQPPRAIPSERRKSTS